MRIRRIDSYTNAWTRKHPDGDGEAHCSSLIDKCFDERHEFVVAATELAVPDDAVPIQQHHRRLADEPKLVGQQVVAVQRNIKAVSMLTDVRHRIVAIKGVDRKHLYAVGPGLVDLLDFGEVAVTGRTPTGPEEQQCNIPAQRRC